MLTVFFHFGLVESLHYLTLFSFLFFLAMPCHYGTVYTTPWKGPSEFQENQNRKIFIQSPWSILAEPFSGFV